MSWYTQLLIEVRQRIDVRQQPLENLDDSGLRELVERIIQLPEIQSLLPDNGKNNALTQRVMDDLVGLGALEPLLRDAGISEIMVNSPSEIYVERDGCLSLSDACFVSEPAVRQVIERMVSAVGRRIDVASPMVDARLACGARVNAVIPPLALKGSCITIRKFSQRISSAEDLWRQGSCTKQLMKFLKLAVEHRRNIVVCGGTGTGKTTLLNILANWIAQGERVITIEDSAELSLNHQHLVALEARPANQEGEGAVTIRQLVINALRMRPDRILVGECRGGESLDMLQAMNTGHAGSMTTLHANSPRDGLRRLEVMVMMAGMELPLAAIRQQISSAIDIVVQLTRLPSGQRIISQVSEVQGLEGDMLSLADIFCVQAISTDASQVALQARPTGDIPLFVQSLDNEQRAQAYALVAP